MANVIHRDQLAVIIANKAGCSKGRAEEILDIVLGSVQDALANHDGVTITRFGSFKVSNVAPRPIRMIAGERAGEIVDVPATKRGTFNAGTELKQVVAGK